VTDALILRRYSPPQKADQSDAWTVPDDRKVNPWDLNEHNPGETGTMGTIPGPVIECSLSTADRVHLTTNFTFSPKDIMINAGDRLHGSGMTRRSIPSARTPTPGRIPELRAAGRRSRRSSSPSIRPGCSSITATYMALPTGSACREA
jgi:hypothetical protein